jgi:hypothetical protein
MKLQTSVLCGISTCCRSAMKAAVLGTQRFCVVPPGNDVKIALPFLHYNLCDIHLEDVRANFTEVCHDSSSSDFSHLAFHV